MKITNVLFVFTIFTSLGYQWRFWKTQRLGVYLRVAFKVWSWMKSSLQNDVENWRNILLVFVSSSQLA